MAPMTSPTDYFIKMAPVNAFFLFIKWVGIFVIAYKDGSTLFINITFAFILFIYI